KADGSRISVLTCSSDTVVALHWVRRAQDRCGSRAAMNRRALPAPSLSHIATIAVADAVLPRTFRVMQFPTRASQQNAILIRSPRRLGLPSRIHRRQRGLAARNVNPPTLQIAAAVWSETAYSRPAMRPGSSRLGAPAVIL